MGEATRCCSEAVRLRQSSAPISLSSLRLPGYVASGGSMKRVGVAKGAVFHQVWVIARLRAVQTLNEPGWL